MSDRHIETLFCDDIRHEVSGKLTFVGVYSSHLFVPKFPITLPKLCLAVKVISPGSQPLEALSLRIFRNDETLQKIDVDEQQLATASDSVDQIAESQREGAVQTAQFFLVFSPIQFDAPCTLVVRAQTESGELRGLSLQVQQAAQDIQPAQDRGTRH
jgi:hypothetical protein